MPAKTPAPGRTAASRLLAILATFGPDHQALRLSDIARRADLSLTTTHRLLAELAEWGAVVRRDDGDYVIGKRLWEIGLLAPDQTGLREAAAPFISDIHATTLATVHLAVRDGTEVLYLDRMSGHASVPVISTVGSRLPLHATGVGKVLLAHAPDLLALQVLSQLTRITPYTITQPGLLAEQLARVRTDGYASTIEEMTLGACSAAVPVFGPHGTVEAAIGVVVPKLGRDLDRYVSALQVAARGIGRRLDSTRHPGTP